MTSKEILHANLLDILFEGRNKAYGAYALRRGYNYRLLAALGAGLSVILLFLFINTLKRSSQSTVYTGPVEDSVKLTSVQLPPDQPPAELPELKPEAPKTVSPPAAVKYTTPLLVDDLFSTGIPDISALENNAISNANRPGENTGSVPDELPVAGGGAGAATETPVTGNEPGPSSGPEFPGGFDALKDFLSLNLATPHDLDAGEKKIVKARFVVDKDGSVSAVEIEVSGGKAFDREVIRVCRRMPKWKPAIQNGHTVKVSYILPVTFIGAEQ